MATLGKTDIARRTATGKKSVWFPVSTPALTETPIDPPGCAGCTGCTTARPAVGLAVEVPLGETRYQRFPDSMRMLAVDCDRVQDWLFVIHYGLHGYIGDDIILNVGGGNAVFTSGPYEVLSVTGNTLSLLGPNPKRIAVGANQYQAIPPGAMVAWADGAVYNPKKFYPLAEAILCTSTATGNVTFTVDLSEDAPAAMAPEDLADAGTHTPYVVFRWEANQGTTSRRYQSLKDGHFERFTETVTGGSTITRSGFVPPWQFLAAGVARADLLTTTYSTGTYSTAINLTTFTGPVALAYWRPAAGTPEALFQAECSNYHTDPSGSYGGAYCLAAAVLDSGGNITTPEATRRADAHAGCRFADCSRYAIGDSVASLGGLVATLPACPGEWAWLSGLWHRTGWVERQLAAGSTTRDLYRPGGGGYSVCTLYGAWSELVIGSQEQGQRWPFEPGSIGQRRTDSDITGATHTLALGAFWASEECAFGSLPDGLLPATVAAWETGKTGLVETPWRYTGNRETYNQAASAPNVPTHAAANWEEYLTNVSIPS